MNEEEMRADATAAAIEELAAVAVMEQLRLINEYTAALLAGVVMNEAFRKGDRAIDAPEWYRLACKRVSDRILAVADDPERLAAQPAVGRTAIVELAAIIRKTERADSKKTHDPQAS